jgi:hypothetical protein
MATTEAVTDSLLPRNAWGGKVDPAQLAKNIVTKMQQKGIEIDLDSARSALLYTSKQRGRTRVYYQSYAEELIVKVSKADGVTADSSEVHGLLAEGYTDDNFLVRVALATNPHNVEAARAMLQQHQQQQAEEQANKEAAAAAAAAVQNKNKKEVVDLDQLAAELVTKMSQQGVTMMDLSVSRLALSHTSSEPHGTGTGRVYDAVAAAGLVVMASSLSADATNVHSLLAEGYSDDNNNLLVRIALAAYPDDMDGARTMLEKHQQAETKLAAAANTTKVDDDPDQLVADLVTKIMDQKGIAVTATVARIALSYTSNEPNGTGTGRVYHPMDAQELLVTASNMSADETQVHLLLAESYTDDDLLIRMALSAHPDDLDAARDMLQQVLAE